MRNKDVLIWVWCFLLFAAGAVWGQIIPTEQASKWDKFFSLVTSLATCGAAIAAWNAAEIAKQQSVQNSASMRWQMYKTHWDSFNDWLDGMERELAVEFFGRTALYDSLFPRNRKGEDFSVVGSDIFLTWYSLFFEVNRIVSACEEPNRAEIAEWAKGYLDLASSMHFSYGRAQADQLWLGGVVPTGITLKNYDHVTADAGIILQGLADFAYRENCPGGKDVSGPFRAGFDYFIVSVINGSWRQHEFRAV